MPLVQTSDDLVITIRPLSLEQERQEVKNKPVEITNEDAMEIMDWMKRAEELYGNPLEIYRKPKYDIFKERIWSKEVYPWKDLKK